jgi:flagellar hook-associated protein 1 FlgK
LNEKIASSPGALDLKDQRGHLLERLNQIAKVTTFEDNAGRYNIIIGGTPLVDGGKVYRMAVSTDINDNMRFHVNLPGEMRDVTNHIAGGELKANLDLRDNKSFDFMNRLNAFAFNLINAVNIQHRIGFGLDGVGNRDFFNSPPLENAARDISVAITDPRMIAAAQDRLMLPGDNRNARAIADLINQRIIAGTTPVDYYRSLVADAGVEAMSAKTSLRFYNTLVEELERKRQEISGVSLDEEAANLIKYQKLFEAGARMIRVADELLETLINMVGR